MSCASFNFLFVQKQVAAWVARLHTTSKTIKHLHERMIRCAHEDSRVGTLQGVARDGIKYTYKFDKKIMRHLICSALAVANRQAIPELWGSLHPRRHGAMSTCAKQIPRTRGTALIGVGKVPHVNESEVVWMHLHPGTVPNKIGR